MARSFSQKAPAGFLFTASIFSHMFPFRFSNFMKQLLASLVFCGLAMTARADELKTVDAFREAGTKANAVLSIPDWEQTPEAVETAMKNAIATANAALDKIGAQDLGKVTFKSTIVALDDLGYQARLTANKAYLMKETNKSEALRTAAENAVKIFQDWGVGVDYREDVYKAIKAFEKTQQAEREDAKCSRKTCGIIAGGPWRRREAQKWSSCEGSFQARHRFRCKHCWSAGAGRSDQSGARGRAGKLPRFARDQDRR